MKHVSFVCAGVLALVLIATPALAKELSIPDFAVDPSGPGYTISAMTPGYGATNNVTDISIGFGAVDDIGTTDMLAMNWQPDDPNQTSQAGWSLVFGTDPDLTNHTLSLSIRPPGAGPPPAPPGGMTQVEVHIVDMGGVSCGGWGFNTDQFWAVPPGVPVPMANDPLALGQAPVPFGPVPPPPMVELASMAQGGPGGPPMFVHNVTINIGNGPVAGSAVVVGPGGPLVAPNYLIPSGGGNLANAARLDFYENGILAGGQAVPFGGPAGLNNWWTNIQLTGPAVPPIPEPGALSLLGLGVVGLRARRRRG